MDFCLLLLQLHAKPRKLKTPYCFSRLDPAQVLPWPGECTYYLIHNLIYFLVDVVRRCTLAGNRFSLLNPKRPETSFRVCQNLNSRLFSQVTLGHTKIAASLILVAQAQEGLAAGNDHCSCCFEYLGWHLANEFLIHNVFQPGNALCWSWRVPYAMVMMP
jgi:hypothetical protein